MATESTVERRTWRVKEAAAMAGISETKMRELIKAGEAPGRHLGRVVLIPRGLFAKWLESYLGGEWEAPK